MDETYTSARSSNQVDESKSFRLSDSVLWLEKIIQEQTKDGTLNSKNLISPIPLPNFLESTENRLSSTGIFPMTCFIGSPPTRYKKTCKIKTLNPNILKDGIIFMSMFNDID